MAVEDSVVAKLSDLFRKHGYDGASLSRISEATGLVKASLYHRFPKGKDEMAACVLQDVAREFASHVLAPIGEEGDLELRLTETGHRIQAFYANGKLPCLLDTMTLNTENAEARALAAQAMEAWIGAFESAAKQGGWKKIKARQRAEDAVASIEGALILARVSGNRAPFLRAIEGLSRKLIRR